MAIAGLVLGYIGVSPIAFFAVGGFIEGLTSGT
jgi:hypothetical protein